MDDEWDLHAVVKSCTTVSAGGATTTIPVAGVDHQEDNDDEGLIYKLENIKSENPYSYGMFGGLEEVYEGGCCGQPPQSAAVSSVPRDGQGFVNEQLPMLKDSLSFSIHAQDSQFMTTRKRKNQEKKMVFQLRQEELSNDTWSWRKYGQKPIKGSPYPRNYYRCSTTKACAAKKQVERSPMDPAIFIVSYAGEHIHPRPTHRNSLAGSTRSNKFSTDNIKPPISGVPECSSATTSSFSLTSSLMEDENEMSINEEEEDDQDILIPNTDMNEELLKGFQELNGGSGDGGNF